MGGLFPSCNRTVTSFSSSPGPDDYTAVDRLLVFDGSTDSIMVDVPIVDDDLAEDDEVFSVELLLESPSDFVAVATQPQPLTSRW